MSESAGELSARADTLEAQAAELRRQASAARKAALLAQPLADRLIYAADVRCPCGFGMAYDPAAEGDGVFNGPSKWECAGVLLKTGDRAKLHQPPMPFAFYEVKSEHTPSAGGRTTREFKPPSD